MITPNQLLRASSGRKKIKNKINPIFQGCPQKRGVCLEVKILNPNKPNSADRKVAVVMLTNGKRITVYISGEGHNIQQHSQLLIRGGKRADLPVVKGIIIRGALGAAKVEKRKTSKSKY